MSIRDEILQSTQRLMKQIDQIAPVEISTEEIEKSQNFIQSIADNQTERSQDLLKDVSNWGDRRKDQYKQFEKPLLKSVEDSVNIFQEEANTMIPKMQERIDNYERKLGNAKSSIVTLSESLCKSANEKFNNNNIGADSNGSDGISMPAQLQLNLPNSNSNSNIDVNNPISSADVSDKTNFDILQQLKLREEHLMTVVKSMNQQIINLENTISTEKKSTKNLQFQVEYLKKHTYSPDLAINNLIDSENYKIINKTTNLLNVLEIPLKITNFDTKNVNTDEPEKKIAVLVIENSNYSVYPDESFIRDKILNELKTEIEENRLLNKSNQNVQCDLISLFQKEKEAANNNLTPVNKFGSNEITISKDENGETVFNYPENIDSEKLTEDLDELINLHKSSPNGAENININEEEEEEEYEDNNEHKVEDEQQMEINDKERIIDVLEVISDFEHAAKIVEIGKEKYILTSSGIKLKLDYDINTKSASFKSTNGQNLQVTIKNEEKCEIYLKEEKENNNKINQLPIVINKNGDAYLTNSTPVHAINEEKKNVVKKTALFMNSNGETFIHDEKGNQVSVIMNENGQIVYEMENGEFIQVATHGNGDLYYIDDEGNKKQMFISENGEFYVIDGVSKARIPIVFNFKNKENNEPRGNNDKQGISPENRANNANNNNKNEIGSSESTKETNVVHNNLKNGEDNEHNKNNSKNNTKANIKTNADEKENENENENEKEKEKESLVPYSISCRDDKVKIIYKDRNDAVVVNANVSHCTDDGQLILNHNVNEFSNGVRIVGGFSNTFVRNSRRKHFKYSLQPKMAPPVIAKKTIELSINLPDMSISHHTDFSSSNNYYGGSGNNHYNNLHNNENDEDNNSYIINHSAYYRPKRTNMLSNQTKNELNQRRKDPSQHWSSFPVRPPPPCCRKRPDTMSMVSSSLQQQQQQKIQKQQQHHPDSFESNDKDHEITHHKNVSTSYGISKRKIVMPNVNQSRQKAYLPRMKQFQMQFSANKKGNVQNGENENIGDQEAQHQQQQQQQQQQQISPRRRQQ